ncbi:hypothetical protein Pden_4331 [Paracoccus denitrificans PD1222]|uniref:Uncharacterized protein n=1 Tax=Paracoccus denitrificans (strain Pd 1222) TaxID=318586 RepID=A1BA51_PARDP|nr:hypothetical protein Pden_4331 [Paracoccus denitrificans PD1222]
MREKGRGTLFPSWPVPGQFTPWSIWRTEKDGAWPAALFAIFQTHLDCRGTVTFLSHNRRTGVLENAQAESGPMEMSGVIL